MLVPLQDTPTFGPGRSCVESSWSLTFADFAKTSPSGSSRTPATSPASPRVPVAARMGVIAISAESRMAATGIARV